MSSFHDGPRLSRRTLLIAAVTSLVAACGRRVARRAATAAAPTARPPTPATAPTAVQVTAVPPTAPPATVRPTAISVAPTVVQRTLTPAPPDRAADAVFVNGTVLTIDSKNSVAQAVAVKDGLIQAVGAEAEIRALVGGRTVVHDLKGRTLTPGIVDPHNHVQIAGMMDTFYVAMMPPEVRDLKSLQGKVAEVVARTPKGQWVQAYFLAIQEGRLPNRQDLDPVSPDHPVWLLQQGGHYGSANSVALKAAGITRDTRDPVGGMIERDAKGEPTGVFYNHRAMDMLRRAAPQVTPQDTRNNIRSAQRVFAAQGITTFCDNNVRGVESVKAYLDAGHEDDMLLRGSIYYTLEWPQDLQRALNEVPREPESAMMKLAGFKFLLDGQMKMAYCHEPHTGVRWDLPTWEPQSFRDAVKALHATGLQISVHCAGDAAVDLTLDAYEAAMNAQPRSDPRHRIEHCIVSTEAATRRFVDLGVGLNIQPHFIRLAGDMYEGLLGAARTRRVIVTREWLDAGVHMSLGTDAPTTPWLGPVMVLASAVMRAGPTNKPFMPEQAITAEEALRAFTISAAYTIGEEKTIGSLEVDKYADLVIWKEDPLATKVTPSLLEGPVDLTMVGGKVVFEA